MAAAAVGADVGVTEGAVAGVVEGAGVDAAAMWAMTDCIVTCCWTRQFVLECTGRLVLLWAYVHDAGEVSLLAKSEQTLTV